MTSEGLGEMFEGDSADTCGEKFPLVSMGGQVEGLACADPGARNLIGTCGNFVSPINIINMKVLNNLALKMINKVQSYPLLNLFQMSILNTLQTIRSPAFWVSQANFNIWL